MTKNMADKEKQKTNLAIVDEIEEKILIIRGQKVMLDSDLAEVYQVETRVLNQAVKRNLNRFPEDFMFQLSDEEVNNLSMRSQSVIAPKRNIRYRPYVFTEHGAVMLASILKSQTAIDASIEVIKAFVKMRSILALHQDLAERLEKLEKTTDKYDQNFAVVSQLLSDIFNNPKYLKSKIGFIEEKKGKS